MNQVFTNQVALITGAASGLGLAIAKELAKNGARLALFDLNIEKLEEITSQFENEVLLVKVNLVEETEVRQAIEQTYLHFKKIDILVNSAGITGITNVKSHQVETEDLRKVFDINFMGAWFTSKYVLPKMLKQDYGRILHIASVAGKEGNAGMLAYSASKAAVIGMTKVQGKEYAETNITVNALAPAVIRTALVEAMPEQQVKYMTDKIPMKRCCTIDEVINTVLFIIDKKNSFTTGFTFDLSGGRATY